MKSLLAASSLLVLTGCSTVQGWLAPAPVAVADVAPALAVIVHEGDFARIQQFTTPGGVSVWLVSEPSIPILSVEMAWKGGSAADPAGLEGLGNAVTYGMNEGAGDLDALGFQTRMEDLNMSFGCSISGDWTSCSASMLTDNAPESMDLVAMAFSAPRYDEGPFERFLREQEVSLKTRETSAGFLAGRARAATLWPDHPFARETSAESLAALTPETARTHMRALMTKDRLLVTAVGAVTPEELAPMIDLVAAGLPESSVLPETPVITLPAEARPDPIVVNLPQPQSLVQFIGPGMTRDNPDFYPAFVLNYTFGGGGFESRLMKTLRVEKGLTYGIGTGVNPDPVLATWSGSGQTKNESVGEFIAGIHTEMTKFIESGATDAELNDAKAYLVGSYPLGFDSNAKIASQMMGVRRDELGVDFFDHRNALIEAVTIEDVNRVAAQYLRPANFTFVVVGEPQGIAAPAPAAP